MIRNSNHQLLREFYYYYVIFNTFILICQYYRAIFQQFLNKKEVMQLKPPVAVSQLNLCVRVKYRSDKMSRTDKNKIERY